MDKLIYTALSGQSAIDQRMQQISNEVANVSTVGFKRSFAAAMQTIRYDGAGFDTRFVAVPNPSNSVDMKPGTVNMTGRNLDISLDGSQLLGVLAADGSVAYTRRGDLSIARDGTLHTGAGDQVLSDAGGRITLPALGSFKIGADGSVLVSPQGDQTSTFVPLARLQIVQPADGKVVLREDGLFKSADGQPFPASTSPRLTAGGLEGSNASVFAALIDMVSLSRRYEMQIKVLKQADELAQRTQQLSKLSG